MIRKASLFVRENWHWMLLAVIMLAVLIARIYHVNGYPYHEDEIVSIKAMQSIVENGFPLFGDAIYWRALLSHYLTALPLFFMEVSPLSTRLVCILMSVLLLPAIFRVGCRLHGRLAGLLAVCVLSVSAYENLFASFARFYLPQQFFFIWALFLAYIYFVEGDKNKGLWLFLAVAGTLSTHRLGVMVWLPMVLAFLLGKRWSLLRSPWFLVVISALLIETYMLDFWVPANNARNPFTPTLQIGNPEDILVFARWLRDMLPGVWAATMLGFAALLLDKQRRKVWIYYGSTFLLTLLVVSFMAPGDNPRYMIQAFPLAVVIGCAGLVWFVSEMVAFATQKTDLYRQLWTVAVFAVVVLTAGLIAWQIDRYNLDTALGYDFHFVDQKPAHDFLTVRMAQNDLLISADPGITEFYLQRRADYFLREKYDSQTKEYGPFLAKIKGERPEYFIDSTQQLQQVLDAATGKVWLYANWKLEWAIGSDLDQMVRRHFQLVFQRGETWVLVSSPQRQYGR